MGFRMIGHRSSPAWEDTAAATSLTAELAYVALADRDYRAQWPMDSWPGYEVVYVRAGSLLLWLEDGCLRAGPGDVLVIPPRVLHREETPADGFSEAIYLGAILRRESGRQCHFPLPIKRLVHVGQGSAVEQRVQQIVAEMQERAPGYTSVVSGAVLEIFWHLARASEGTAAPAPAPVADLSLTTFAQEAQDYLARHHTEALSIDEVARHFRLSRQYFTKLFRRVTGQPPHAYLTQVRLQRARQLLTSTKLSVQAVAEAVGFSDPYYFSRCFRQHTGLTPTQYRQQSPPGD